MLPSPSALWTTRLGWLLLATLSAVFFTLTSVWGLAQAAQPAAMPHAPTSGGLTRLTFASASNRTSDSPSISAAGTRIAFSSDSDLLNQGIADNQFEVWLYDTTTLTYTRITTASDSTRDSSSPRLSADGTRVVFWSNSDLLGQGLGVSQPAIWLYDTTTMTYTRLALVMDNTDPEHPRSIGSPTLNANGTRIAFHTDSDLRGQGILDEQFEIWLYDTVAMTLTRVTTATPTFRYSTYPEFSGDGTQVYFHSDADFLNQGIPQYQTEVWAYAVATRTYTRLTNSPGSDSVAPAPNSTGTRVAFNSSEDFLGQGANHFEVWVYDRTTFTYSRVTNADFPRDSWSHFVSLSPNGNKVGFVSDSDFFGSGGVQNQYYLWLYDLTTQTYTRLPDTGNRGFGLEPISLNADGSRVAFADGVDVWLYQPFQTYLPFIHK